MQDMLKTLFHQGASPLAEEDVADLLKEMNAYIERRFKGAPPVVAGHLAAVLDELIPKCPGLARCLKRNELRAIARAPEARWRLDEAAAVARSKKALAYLLGFYGPGFSVIAFDLHRESWVEGIEERSRRFPALDPLSLGRMLGLRFKTHAV